MKLTTAILIFTVAAFIAFGNANAGHDRYGEHDHRPPARTEKAGEPILAGEIVHIRVNGLVCDFCARSIYKVFLKTDVVEETDVNLRRGFVTVYLKKGGNLPDGKIRKLINDSGYEVVSISRYRTGDAE